MDIITVDDKEVLANIQRMVSGGLDAALGACLEKVGELVEGEAKEKAPVDDGQLRASITHRVDEAAHEVAIGTNVDYGPYMEVGTGIYSTEGNGRQTPWRYCDAAGNWHTTSGNEAHPFLKPAVDENRARIVECFRGGLENK